MFASLASSIALRNRGLPSGLPPPVRAAIVISRMIRVKTFPRLESISPFLCLIPAQRECPDMVNLFSSALILTDSEINEKRRGSGGSDDGAAFGGDFSADTGGI